MSRFWVLLIFVGLVQSLTCVQSLQAQLTPEHRKELNELNKDVGKIGALIRKKELDEAEKALVDVEARLKTISEAAKLTPSDPLVRRTTTLIEKQQAALEKAGGKKMPAKDEVMFMRDIAPLVISRCVQCHGEDKPRNNLRLDAFAGWRAGGKSGPLLTPGNSSRSLIMARVHAEEGKGRMPPNGAALTAEEKEKLAQWIDGGAKFDGANETTTLANLIYEEEAKNVVIPKPKGGETVRFTRDIAPWFTNLCLNCHNSRRKSGGLSVETFFDIMRGGESGEVIIPGDMENSRLFRLVGGKELPRMPQGQARITRKNYEDLVKWFQEGNTFDGADPRAPIASYSPTDNEMAQRSFTNLSDDELKKLRIERTEEQYRKAISSDPHSTLTSDNFYIVGNVSEERLKQVEGWSDEHLKSLQKAFGTTDHPWRGRLAIFVLKDGFNYNEFNEVIERRRPDPELTGHSRVTAGQEDAYIVVRDVGDETANGLTLHVSLIENLTGAYLLRSGKPLPDWVVRGTGLAMADTAIPDRKRSDVLEKTAASLVTTLPKAENLFADGSFSPSGTSAVGYTLVKFLMASGGPAKFSQFIKALEGGAGSNAALQAAYGAPAATIATGYFSKLKSR